MLYDGYGKLENQKIESIKGITISTILNWPKQRAKQFLFWLYKVSFKHYCQQMEVCSTMEVFGLINQLLKRGSEGPKLLLT